jgi:hypothetical protein
MTGAYRMSKRMVQTFCADVLGVPVCAGRALASEAQTAASRDAVVKEARDYARGQPANPAASGGGSTDAMKPRTFVGRLYVSPPCVVVRVW